MTGMKEGAGEDPFAADDGTADAATAGSEAGSAEDPPRADGEHRRPGADGTASGGASGTGRDGAGGSGDAPAGRSMRIPYKFRRDGVQDGRDRVPLFLQAETKAAERDALREFEERFDEDVSLTDLREALVMVGLDDLDAVESRLEGWGYGLTFEE